MNWETVFFFLVFFCFSTASKVSHFLSSFIATAGTSCSLPQPVPPRPPLCCQVLWVNPYSSPKTQLHDQYFRIALSNHSHNVSMYLYASVNPTIIHSSINLFSPSDFELLEVGTGMYAFKREISESPVLITGPGTQQVFNNSLLHEQIHGTFCFKLCQWKNFKEGMCMLLCLSLTIK